MAFEHLVKILTVIGLGILELWAAVPAGLALGLHPVVTALAAASGAWVGALLVVAMGEPLRAWILQRHGHRGEEKPPGIIHRVWRRYGVIGLGLLAPLLTGTPLGVALGLALGAPPRRLLFWTSLGIGFGSAALTVASVLGWAVLQALPH